eukprot:scaffold8140_cov248-Pinguiococcus_pyrenoidosus.AAC.2
MLLLFEFLGAAAARKGVAPPRPPRKKGVCSPLHNTEPKKLEDDENKNYPKIHALSCFHHSHPLPPVDGVNSGKRYAAPSSLRALGCHSYCRVRERLPQHEALEAAARAIGEGQTADGRTVSSGSRQRRKRRCGDSGRSQKRGGARSQGRGHHVAFRAGGVARRYEQYGSAAPGGPANDRPAAERTSHLPLRRARAALEAASRRQFLRIAKDAPIEAVELLLDNHRGQEDAQDQELTKGRSKLVVVEGGRS